MNGGMEYGRRVRVHSGFTARMNSDTVLVHNSHRAKDCDLREKKKEMGGKKQDCIKKKIYSI